MHNVQHVFRKYKTADFEAVKAGTRAFDLCLDTEDLQLEVGDLITFQEVDSDGNITGEELTKKISHKVSTRKDDGSSGVPDGADKAGLSIFGFVPTEMQTLRSIYNYGYTMDLVLDKDSDDSQYLISDGPNYAPTIAAPDLRQGGILEHLRIEKWPAGRYSVTLMVRVEDSEEEDAKEEKLQMYIADALVMVVVKDPTEDQEYGGFVFEELDTRALLNGQLISTDEQKVTAMPVEDIVEIINRQLDEQEEQDPEEIKRMMAELERQVSGFTSVPVADMVSMGQAELRDNVEDDDRQPVDDYDDDLTEDDNA